MKFNSSPRSTIGVEVEYGIVDRATGDLVPRASEILTELCADRPGGIHPKVKHELFLCSLEVITGICENPASARADLAATLREIKPLLDARNLGLESTGTHPFANWRGMPITPNERYERMVDRIKWPARRLLIHGVHVHVGVRSAEKAIATTNALTTYLPVILALSTSSPFWHGQDTGLASARTKIFEGMPTTGIPPRLENWAEYTKLLKALIRAGTIETVREVWWDIRPHPDFGTVELRMSDGIPTLRETMAIAAIAQCLVTEFDQLVDAGIPLPMLPDWVLRENKWRACRYGLAADLIVDDTGATRPLTSVLRDLVIRLTPLARLLGCEAELANALEMSRDGSSSQRQRALVRAGASLQEVVDSLVAEFDADLAASETIA